MDSFYIGAEVGDHFDAAQIAQAPVDDHPAPAIGFDRGGEVVADEVDGAEEVGDQHVAVDEFVDDPGVGKADAAVFGTPGDNGVVEVGPDGHPAAGDRAADQHLVGAEHGPVAGVVVLEAIVGEQVASVVDRDRLQAGEYGVGDLRAAVGIALAGPRPGHRTNALWVGQAHRL